MRQRNRLDRRPAKPCCAAKSTANNWSLLLALRPFDEKPFFRPGLAAFEVAPADANTQTRKARSQRPLVRPPCFGRKAEGKGFDLDGLILGIAAQALGRCPRPGSHLKIRQVA